jgi:hypothetical protein
MPNLVTTPENARIWLGEEEMHANLQVLLHSHDCHTLNVLEISYTTSKLNLHMEEFLFLVQEPAFPVP